MSRLSIRPRPLDIHKKLPVVKSIKEFDDDDTLLSSGARNSQLFRLYYNEVNSSSTKKPASEIPTPQFVVVDTYERDYTRTFVQPTSYLHGRGARAELGEFVEYDLDNEDEDWIEEYNKDKIILAHKEFESILFKLDVFDHKTRERAGVINQMLGSPVPVLLTLDAAIQALQFVDIKYSVFQSIYNYWKEKRERWQKPVLRCVQPPPPSNDTNPYNVFRPREKTHRLHTRRMQRRENNVQSFEKLRLVRRNFEQAKTILKALIKREEKKRDVMECEVSLQRKLKYKHETKLVEDSFTPIGCTTISSEFVSSEEEFLDSDDVAYGRPLVRLPLNIPFTDNNLVTGPPRGINQEFRRHPGPNGWLNRKDPEEPVLLFTRPLIPEKMVEAGIDPPSDSLASNGAATQPYKLHGRIGRGGRIVFDRWNPLMQTPAECNNSYYVPPKPRSAAYN